MTPSNEIVNPNTISNVYVSDIEPINLDSPSPPLPKNENQTQNNIQPKDEKKIKKNKTTKIIPIGKTTYLKCVARTHKKTPKFSFALQEPKKKRRRKNKDKMEIDETDDETESSDKDQYGLMRQDLKKVKAQIKNGELKLVNDDPMIISLTDSLQGIRTPSWVYEKEQQDELFTPPDSPNEDTDDSDEGPPPLLYQLKSNNNTQPFFEQEDLKGFFEVISTNDTHPLFDLVEPNPRKCKQKSLHVVVHDTLEKVDYYTSPPNASTKTSKGNVPALHPSQQPTTTSPTPELKPKSTKFNPRNAPIVDLTYWNPYNKPVCNLAEFNPRNAPPVDLTHWNPYNKPVCDLTTNPQLNDSTKLKQKKKKEKKKKYKIKKDKTEIDNKKQIKQQKPKPETPTNNPTNNSNSINNIYSHHGHKQYLSKVRNKLKSNKNTRTRDALTKRPVRPRKVRWRKRQ